MEMIRQASNRDIPSLLLLLQQLFSIEADFAFDPQRQTQGLALLLDSPRSIILVAEDQGKVVGMATAQLVISTAEGGMSLLVEDVVVDPARHNRGIGSRLLQAIGDWGKGCEAGRMQLLADRTNQHALHFYKTRDWQQTQLICLRKYHKK